MEGSDTGTTMLLQTLLTGQQTLQADVSALRGDVSRALTHLEVIDNRNASADELHRDHEARLRILERFRWTLAGFSMVGGIVAGAVGYWIGHVLH